MTSAPPLGRVGVVIVNYRSLPELRTCLAQPALRGLGQVVVVDNASDPDAVAELCAVAGRTAVLRADNGGFAVGVNAGVAALRPDVEVVWLLNPDVAVDVEVRDVLLAALDGRDGVGPNLVEPSGRGQVGAAGGPLTARAVAAYFLFVSQLLPAVTGVVLTRRQARRDRDVRWLCMAAPMLRRDAFGRFGPVPEDELVYAEDLAWGTAASARGARFRLLGSVSAVHAHGASGGSDRWVGALERLLRRRLGRGRGAAAVAALRTGLAVRRAVRRISRRPVRA